MTFSRVSRPSWFTAGHQQDCSEYLRFLLDQLHEQEKSRTKLQLTQDQEKSRTISQVTEAAENSAGDDMESEGNTNSTEGNDNNVVKIGQNIVANS